MEKLVTFYSFDVKVDEGGDVWWRPVTLANAEQLMGYLGPETTIRRMKVWGN